MLFFNMKLFYSEMNINMTWDLVLSIAMGSLESAERGAFCVPWLCNIKKPFYLQDP